ncbi:MAG: glycosyltransferase family 39 protein [Candidatus Krumholzibacteria bacterium]|nr:glycosyltransferase family 39 protein [Candidatus Krumholzibacteria bacterium]
MNRKASTLLPVLVFLVAAAIRVHFAARCDAAPDYSDMELYNAAALEHGFPTSLPPGYPLFLRAIYGVFGERNYEAVFVAQGLISALTVLLIYRVTRRIGGTRAGVVAAAVAAVYPNLIVYNLTTMTDTFGVLFVMLLYCALVASIDDWKKSVWAAVILGVGFTFRPVLLFFGPGVLLSLRRRLAFMIAAVVVFVPLMAFEMTGGEDFKRAAAALYKTYGLSLDGRIYVDSTLTEVRREDLPSKTYLGAVWNAVKNNKGKVAQKIFNKATVLFEAGWDEFVMRPIVGSGKGIVFAMKYAYIPILALGFVGMARLYGAGNRMIALPALSYVLLVIVFSIFKYRYRLLIEPALIMYASMLVGRPHAPAAARGGAAPE